MLNKKGFTLIELLVVIIIISLITTIAAVSVTKNRQVANDKEKVALRQTIISAFENYRIHNAVDSMERIPISRFSFTSDLSYNNNKCSYDNSLIKYVIKKDVLAANPNLLSSINEELTDIEKTSFTTKIANSLEEVFCLEFYCNGVLIVDDKNNLETNEVLLDDDGKMLKQIKLNYCQ